MPCAGFYFFMVLFHYMKLLKKITSFFKRPVTIVVHDGSFHADDVTAVALLSLYFKQQNRRVKIIRTRVQSVIEKADIVCDVGGIYDPEKNRFDHHQAGGAGERENGVPYASVGLVWKKFGKELCAPYDSLVEKIDRECIQFIDANDNGYDFGQKAEGISSLSFSSSFMIYNGTWKEKEDSCDTDDYYRFLYAARFAEQFFDRYILVSKQSMEASEIVKQAYEQSQDKEILVFDKNLTRTVFIAHLVNYPEPLFHIYPDRSGTWSVEVVPASFGSFEKRISFPSEWAGLRDEELQKVANDTDLVFCHNACFLCKTKTREGAIRIAQRVRDEKTK